MYTQLKDYVKKKDFLICIDSDGCVMDTMDIKHIHCFGPCMVTEWHLEEWESDICTRWNDINLYTTTRGINRFKGLAIALREIHEMYTPIEGIEFLEQWTTESKELSNDALLSAIEKNESEILKKALSWSCAVNQKITELPEALKKPFDKAKEALKFAHEFADIAIVSSANLQAVVEEWEKYGLLEYTDIILTQNIGSKAFCIQELQKKGYLRSNILMTGDAVGDYEAAKSNFVFYYPILVRHEKESWIEFQKTAVNKLISGTYSGEYQTQKIDQFFANLQL